jgi:hypothetical protein
MIGGVEGPNNLSATMPSQGVLPMMFLLNLQIALASANAPRTKRFEAVIGFRRHPYPFSCWLPEVFRVDLAAGELEMTQGIGGSESTYLHEIALYIPGRPVKITAAFKDRLPVAGLLGMHGFFESF